MYKNYKLLWQIVIRLSGTFIFDRNLFNGKPTAVEGLTLAGGNYKTDGTTTYTLQDVEGIYTTERCQLKIAS